VVVLVRVAHKVPIATVGATASATVTRVHTAVVVAVERRCGPGQGRAGTRTHLGHVQSFVLVRFERVGKLAHRGETVDRRLTRDEREMGLIRDLLDTLKINFQIREPV
jgi:hypothetical protein